MPDNEITLKDIWEKLIKIETILGNSPTVANGAIIIDKDSPFWDEENNVYDMGFYRKNHPRDEGENK